MNSNTGYTRLQASRFAQALLAARPELHAELSATGPLSAQDLERALEGIEGEDEHAAKRRLRRLRQQVFLRTMARDLAGSGNAHARLAEVCESMSALADASIHAALAWCNARFAAEHGAPHDTAGAPMPLAVVSMGKLGGRELNVSSDIDLVFLYPEEGDTHGPRPLTHHEYFTRLGRKLIALLSEPTEDGFVFRVDMRLRPYGESGPLVASYDALENYFVSHGRDWERYAWIKARVITGQTAGLDSIVRPFVFRKYLDYATLTAMRRLHGEVRREVARRDLAQHIKLGPGGIREIEFVAQALQIIRGGRDPALTVRPTLEVLARLAEKELLPAEAAHDLTQAYIVLRETEHRLQYLDDRQTHTLPDAADDRERVAQMSDCTSWDVLANRLEHARRSVTRHFEAVFAQAPAIGGAETLEDDPGALAARLAANGFREPEVSTTRLGGLRASQRYAQLPEDSRLRIDRLIPSLVAAASATADPDATLARGLDLVETIARRAAYLALLAEHPQALERVAKIISVSSWAADFVTHHPLLLDELLDDRALYAQPDWPAFARILRMQLSNHPGDTERQMNVLREQHQAQVFRLLAQDLAGLLTVEHLADHLSALADLALEVTLELAWPEVRSRHLAGAPRFAVIGYGKLGGKELGYVSDLDIIFLYDDADERAAEVYARLAQRFNNWLTSRTSSGVLFETDLRLRPSGASGLLVSSIQAFREYQEKNAWAWEHQALTRARYCAGDTNVGQAFEAIREDILRRPREAAALAREVLAMREKMHAAHPNPSGLFDVKHGHGGMIDIEFLVQYLVLLHAHAHPRLTGNLGNIALLGIAGELGLVPADLAERCRAAYRAYRRTQHALRLQGAGTARAPFSELAEHADAVRALWNEVFGTFAGGG